MECHQFVVRQGMPVEMHGMTVQFCEQGKPESFPINKVPSSPTRTSLLSWVLIFMLKRILFPKALGITVGPPCTLAPRGARGLHHLRPGGAGSSWLLVPPVSSCSLSCGFSSGEAGSGVAHPWPCGLPPSFPRGCFAYEQLAGLGSSTCREVNPREKSAETL